METAEAKRKLNRLQETKGQVTGEGKEGILRKDINLQRKYLRLEEKLLAEMG